MNDSSFQMGDSSFEMSDSSFENRIETYREEERYRVAEQTLHFFFNFNYIIG